jgi:hypothetical protein
MFMLLPRSSRVSGFAMLADKPAWVAVYVAAGVAIEAFAVTRR